MKITRILVAISFLFAVSNVNAGELTVTGNMEATYQSSIDGNTGNPLGMDRELKFAATTELDSGITVSVMQDTTDSLAYSNSQIAFGNIMGMGTIYVGSDSDPVDSIDDVTPSAYEEANGSGSGTYVDIGSAAAQMGLGFKLALPIVATNLNYKYYPRMDAVKNGDNSNSGVVNLPNGTGQSFSMITNFGEIASELTGLSLTAGIAELETSTITATDNKLEMTAALNYAYGPIKVGYQKKFNALGETVATTSVAKHKDDVYGIAYAINDALSVSYNRYDSVRNMDVGANEPQSTTALNIGYTIGGMSIGFQDASTDNAGYVKAAKDDTRTLGISVAF